MRPKGGGGGGGSIESRYDIEKEMMMENHAHTPQQKKENEGEGNGEEGMDAILNKPNMKTALGVGAAATLGGEFPIFNVGSFSCVCVRVRSHFLFLLHVSIEMYIHIMFAVVQLLLWAQ